MYTKKNELYHHGVLGMKWGVRKAQNGSGGTGGTARKRKGDNFHDDYKRAHDKKDVKYMSDQELKDRNKRLNMEREYNNMTKKTSGFKKAQKLATAYVATAGTIAGIMAATKTYKKVGNGALDKVGDMLLKDLAFGKLTN